MIDKPTFFGVPLAIDEHGSYRADRSAGAEPFSFVAGYHERFQNWVATLTDDSLQREITYKTSAGSEQRNLLWHSLLHCLNHQTHHRGQITTLLTQLNVDVGDTDLIIMLREFVS